MVTPGTIIPLRRRQLHGPDLLRLYGGDEGSLLQRRIPGHPQDPRRRTECEGLPGHGQQDLAKGVGHFEETSIWDGNVALAAHNRGTNDYFGEIHTLDIGDRITLTTRLGTRTYQVTSVEKISETDRSDLAPSAENRLTLYTCVRDSAGVPLVRPGGGGVMDNLPYAAPPSSVVWSIAFPSSLEYRVAEARRICR